MAGDPLGQLLEQHLFAFRNGVAPRDIDAHLAARAQLNRLLSEDPVVLALFETSGGLVVDGRTLATLTEAYARAHGWRDRADMFAHPDDYETPDAGVNAWWERAVDAYAPGTRMPVFRTAAAALIHETWQLPREHPRERWGWLVDDLQRLFIAMLQNLVLGRAATVFKFSAQQQAPLIDLSFRSRPTETAAETRRRLHALYQEAEALLGPPVTDDKHGVQVGADELVRDVEWFYRTTFLPRASVRALAREYHRAVHGHEKAFDPKADHGPTVRAGIRRARRLLSEIPA